MIKRFDGGPLSGQKTGEVRNWARRGLMACGILSLALLMGAGAGAQVPVPQIDSPLVPNTAAPGTQGVTLTVNGAGFLSSSVANWNGGPLTTTFITNHQLQAVVPVADLATAGTAAVTVVNAGSPASAPVYFTIGASKIASGFGSMSFATGTNPVGVAIGDFFHSGALDLAIANDTDDTILILMGNGEGTFTPGATYPLTGYPINIVAADLNNDGFLDLITANQESSHIGVFLNNGNGTFAAPQYFATGAHPMSLTFGDFNGDGKIDIATPNFADNSVSVLLGKGDGTFQPEVAYAVGSGPLDIKTADLNGDGRLDLVAVNNTGLSISVLLGVGDGTFTPQVSYATASIPNALSIADLNGDGFPDVVTANGSSSISVLLNNGLGGFPTHVDYPSNSYPGYAVGLADFNNDGKVDVVVPNFNNAEVSLYYGNGDGTLKTPATVFSVGASPDGLAVADFNNDGLLDMAVLDEFGETVTILTQTSGVLPRVTPATLNFPVTQANMMSPAMTVTITNVSSSALAINSVVIVGTNANQFTIPAGGNTCPASLAAKASCTVSVVFAPTNGLVSMANLNINDSSGTQTVTLSGRGQISFGLSTDSITFPNTQIGMSVNKTVTLTNGSGTLDIYSIMVTGHDIQDFPETNNCPSVLLPNTTCQITITFAPTIIRTREATVIIMSNSSTPKRGISLSGMGFEITYSPASLNFGTITAGTTSTLTSTFSNSGSTALPITSVTITGPEAKVFSQTNTCNGSIPANGMCVFSVTFAPKTPGTASASLQVVDTDPTNPQVVTLSGMATASAKSRRR